jgi:hypothetical protein
MNRLFKKRIFPQVMAWAAVAILATAVAVAQDSGAAVGQRTDGQIEMDVVHALDASKALKNDMITAATIQGEVTLTGVVASDASSELAESIAGHVAGVSKVNNSLKVGNPQDAQADPTSQAPAETQQDDASAQQPPPAPNDGPLPPSQGQNQAQYPDQGQAQGQPPYPNQGQGQGQPYPNQGQAPPPPYPPARPQYGYPPQRQYAQAPPPPAYAEPTGPVTIPQGTLLQLRTNEGLQSKHAKDGQPVEFTVIRDVAVGGVLALPKGATVHGVITEAKHVGSGDLGGSSELALRLTSLDLGGQSYPLDSDQFKVKGPSKTGQTVGNAVGGGILGTIIGCAVGRGVGCAIGAGAGVAAGVGASAASSGPNVWIPAEALVTFHLNTPVTVNPVNAQEAARLAQGLYRGGPNLYRRGYYGGGPYYAGAYPYYGPVYYRPYYMVGGAYYWR